MEELFTEIENAYISDEFNQKTRMRRYFQYLNEDGKERHGNAVVFSQDSIPISLEFWYQNWRIGSVPLTTYHYIPTDDEGFLRMGGSLKFSKKSKPTQRKRVVLEEFFFTIFSQDSKKPDYVLSFGDIKDITRTGTENSFIIFTQKLRYNFIANNKKEFKKWFHLLHSTKKLYSMITANRPIITEFLDDPNSIFNHLNKNNFELLQNKNGFSFFTYFIENAQHENAHKLIKQNLVHPNDISNIRHLYKHIRRWTNPEQCINFLEFCQRKGVLADFAVVQWWIDYFSKTENMRSEINDNDPKKPLKTTSKTTSISISLQESLNMVDPSTTINEIKIRHSKTSRKIIQDLHLLRLELAEIVAKSTQLNKRMRINKYVESTLRSQIIENSGVIDKIKTRQTEIAQEIDDFESFIHLEEKRFQEDAKMEKSNILILETNMSSSADFLSLQIDQNRQQVQELLAKKKPSSKRRESSQRTHNQNQNPDQENRTRNEKITDRN
eukprot:Anaeramoba_ignava/c20391_g1_i2.p1 GENE.c20391_g1_i2~~c20391_g1_i2.p1  ORF type:complete len:496 (-),score=126.38 c20391_g1_i2:760-2247(-)